MNSNGLCCETERIWKVWNTKSQQELNTALGRKFGLRFTASLTLEGSTKSINLHLGQNEVPQTTKNCTNATCGQNLNQPFCTTCGEVQPTFRGGDNPTGIERPIISEDGQHVEFDMVLQFYGQGRFTHQSNEEMLNAIASAISRVVGQYKYTDIAGNFDKIEDAVSEVTNRIAQTLNLKLDRRHRFGHPIQDARMGDEHTCRNGTRQERT